MRKSEGVNVPQVIVTALRRCSFQFLLNTECAGQEHQVGVCVGRVLITNERDDVLDELSNFNDAVVSEDLHVNTSQEPLPRNEILRVIEKFLVVKGSVAFALENDDNGCCGKFQTIQENQTKRF